ncbi:DUF3604 domain-containing protein [bacterium]|nr:DUF3604 domain-containing protein [bacterium]
MTRGNLPDSIKIIGKHFLKKAIDKIFPPDIPVSHRDKGKLYGLMRSDQQFNLYWGDLHGHSSLSTEAVGSPDEYYDYARTSRKLDFVALTDHDYSMTPAKWRIIRDKAAEYYQPGVFVTFIAYEWTSHFGHKVVLFGSTEVPETIMVRARTDEANPHALWQFLDQYQALTIPHHTLSFQVTTDWSYQNNVLQPLVEIYSKHGSCEFPGSPPVPYKISSTPGKSVIDALNAGHRLGFIGCSDTHCSKPGSEKSMELLTHRLVLKYQSGLTGIYAENLTRPKIWAALLARRTFATTGVRLFLDFRIGDHFMGEQFSTHSAQTIAVWVEAPAPIELLEIVKNGLVFYSENPNDLSTSLALKDAASEPGTCYYYLRLTLQDGHRAWSSPIWVDYV